MSRRWHDFGLSRSSQWERQYRYRMPAPRAAYTSPQSASSVTMLLFAGVLVCSQTTAISNAAPPLPAGTLPVPRANFVTSGNAAAAIAGNTMTVTQQSQRAILNWNSFNIAAGSAVRFNQPAATAVALNRIFDANPSVIQGQLSANGQIYLINRNGILFDKGSQINVNTLIASSLDISDQLFRDGLLSQSTFGPVFQQNPGDPAGSIVVDVGARIQTDASGRVLLFGPSVINRGDIRTPDGQTVLAAGNKVYLRNSQDINLRGFLVEVDTGLVAPEPARAAVNEGNITAERGNITMVGLAVRQSGTLTSTTSTSANGSIRLNASDRVNATKATRPNDPVLVGDNTGALEVTAGSVTRVTLDTNDKASIDSNVTFNPSKVEFIGRQIVHDGTVVAPAGEVTFRAAANADPFDPALEQGLNKRNDSRVFLGANSRIDVSGTTDTVLPMSRNLLAVELRGDELKDVPQQRNGVLRGQKVTIDINKGTNVADVTKQIAAVPKSIGEIGAAGGKVTMTSEGDIVIQAQASIDVSGGRVTYESGQLDTTKLVSQGRAYDIGSASPDLVYEGLLRAGEYSTQNRKWGVTQTFDVGRSLQSSTPGYVAGASAGIVDITAHALALDGTFRGNAGSTSPFQRDAGKVPVAGLLAINDYRAVGNATPQSRSHDVVLQAAPSPVPTAPALPGDALPTEQPLVLSTDFLTRGGFGRLNLARNGDIHVQDGADINLPAGGSASLRGFALTVESSIRAPGGSISLQTIPVNNQPAGALVVSTQSTLSTAGLWVNDIPAVAGAGGASGPLFINGGNIAINAGSDLRLGEVVGSDLKPTTLDVSGGGWINAGGSFRGGNGGNLTLGAGEVRGGGTLQLAAAIRGWAPAAGGTLTLRGSEVTVRDGLPLLTAAGKTWAPTDIVRSGSDLTVPSWIFDSLGFSRYDLRASGALRVEPGTTVNVAAPYLALAQDARLKPTGSATSSVTVQEARPELRRAASLALIHTGVQGDSTLEIGANAKLKTDPGGSVSASTTASMLINGTIEAPAGSIALSVSAPRGGFAPEQSIWLGSQSVLSAAGAVKLTPDPRGRRIGNVLDGGSVRIVADRGFVVSEAGAHIDVSGTRSDLDVLALDGTRKRAVVASNAGSINVTAAEGLLLDGDLMAKGGALGAAGGSVSLALTTRNRNEGDISGGTDFQFGNRAIVLRDGELPSVPSGLKPGAPIQKSMANDLNGLGLFNVDWIARSGVGEFTAKSDQDIRFAGDVALHLDRRIALDAPHIEVANRNVSLSAPVVALGASDPLVQSAPAASSGLGNLNVSANLVELIGHAAVSGASSVTLTSSGDLRVRGIQDINRTNRMLGAFNTAGSLDLNAAQVYPTTLSQFAINSGGDLTIGPTTSGLRAPLSAGGALKLNAPNISVLGTLRAPFGSLDLNATGSLTLMSGSVVSVSGEDSLVPFGATQNSLDWVYNPASSINLLVEQPPEKSVTLSGNNVSLLPGSTVDLSGGGNLYAYEFVPGPGGSKDTLANLVDGKASQTFSVLPSLIGAYAPYDHHYHADSTLKSGDAIYLSGGGGLAPGVYPLLPARYALLPGAFLIRPAASTASIVPGQNSVLLDGTPVIAGYRTTLGAGAIDNRWVPYAVLPGSTARTQAEYRDATANAFFQQRAQTFSTTTPALPADAGRLVLSAGENLALEGARVRATREPGARGAAVDVTANRLALTAADAPDTSGLDGFVQIRVGDLNALNAESLVLGGTRTSTADGTELRVTAQEVVIANSSTAPLRSPEVMVAASDTITVRSDSVVEGVGERAAARIVMGYKFDPQRPVTAVAEIARRDRNADGVVDAADNVDGRGALLRVSGGEQVQVVRNNVADRAQGTLVVQSGANVTGDRSLILDATRDTVLRPGTTIGAGQLTRDTNGDGLINAADGRVGGAVSIAAGLISAGDTASANGGQGVDRGLILSSDLLAQLRAASTLTLRSYSHIDFYGATQIGANDPVRGKPFLSDLELSGAGIRGYDNDGKTSTILAETIRLTNVDGTALGDAPNGNGTLELAAGQVVFGAGNKSISGFGNVTAAATEIRIEDTGTTRVGAALSINAPRVTANNAARQAIRAESDDSAVSRQYFPVVVSKPVAASGAEDNPQSSIAAQLELSGSRIELGSRIVMPGGSVSLIAQGANGDVRLAAEAQVQAQGALRSLAGASVHAPAGTVNLVSQQGNVIVDSGARIDVSSAGSDAGEIAVRAPAGVAALRGAFSGRGIAGFRDGVFKLDARVLNGDTAQSLNDFAALNSKLNSGGFNAERSLRLRSGDITIAAGDTVTAKSVQLAADNGMVAVNGTIDARGSKGGKIVLAARDEVTLSSSGVLLANASAEGGSGGTVLASSDREAVEFAAGSRIDVSKFTYSNSDINAVLSSHTVGANNVSAYAVDMTDSPEVYAKGMTVTFRATQDSRGASTLAVNGLPETLIKRSDGTNTSLGDIRGGDIVRLTFDGTYFRLPEGARGGVHLRVPRNAAGNDLALTARGTITGADEIVGEGVKVYAASRISNGPDSGSNLSTNATGVANTEAANFVLATNFNSSGVRRRLSASAAEAFHVRPGIEVRSEDDLTVSGTPWNLLSWRYNGQPGVLTVRAPGNIAINTSVSDGFSTATTSGQLRDTLSWTYRLTAGADLASALPSAMLPLTGPGALLGDKGNFSLAAGTLLRTGIGEIDLSAGRDFVLGKTASGPNLPTAVVYTAGRPSETFPTAGPNGFPTLNLTAASYPTKGGNLSIRVQQDIQGAISPQLISEWLVRRGQTNPSSGAIVANRNSAWGVNFAQFRQNVGALGGGDVNIESGGVINNLSVMLPTSGRLLGATGSQPDNNNLVITGGGDLTVNAGGDILSGVYYIGRGAGSIRSGGSIVSGRQVIDSNPSPIFGADLPVHTILALGDGRFDVRAAGTVNLETVLNPTVVAQDRSVTTTNRTYFFTYSPNAAARIESLTGDINLKNNKEALQNATPNVNFASNANNSNDVNALVVYPGQLDVRAGSGDVLVGGSMTLYPSEKGGLQMVAGKNVRFDVNPGGIGEQIVNLSDADPRLLLNPLRVPGSTGVVYSDTHQRLVPNNPRFSYALTPVHQNDEGDPVRIIAATGSVSGGALSFAKRAEIYAGTDVRDIQFDGQNLRPGDVTSIVAGRDVVFGTPRDVLTGQQESNRGRIQLSGPGRLEIEAGRNIDLGNAIGVLTRGNIANPALPPTGADVTVSAGISTAPAYGAFVSKYFDDAGLTRVAQFVRTQAGDASLSDQAAIAAFDALPRIAQLSAPFMPDLRRKFYTELTQAGREATQPGGNYQRGFAAIETLFPGTLYRGDLSLLFSQIKTESGGSIDVLVPGGRVNAGQTTPPAQSGSTKEADQLGVLVFENGAVHAFSKGDFAVNESRVFTLRAGDILIWSSQGDIDAGRGAKTAVSAPAPILVTDANGNTSFKFQSVSGSGIRSILTDSNIVPGSVDLIAPSGVVNAGDAGIGAAGNINIAALRVVGADNIQVGGRSTGVPLGDTGSAGRGLAGLGNVASEATRSVEQATRSIGAANQADAVRPGYISVEVLGVGP